MNVCVFKGNMTRDAELSYLNNGTALCKFSLAVNEKFKQGDEWKDRAHFFDFTIWGKRGESLHRYLLKGTALLVHAQARHERWQTQDGSSRSRVTFVVREVEFAGGKSGSGQQESPSDSHGSDSVDDGDFVDDVPF